MKEKTWRNLVEINKLDVGDVTPISFEGRDLAIYDTVDGVTVSMARCTHGAANLCYGYFDGKNIECPFHQGLFDARTGEAVAAPARVKLRMIESRVENEWVQVKL
jgi:nitrite reductase/ring-hydroxylating ferredoxin subunit